MTDHPVQRRKKLIEVAIPLEAINAASAREKSIRHGHPSTLHLWWARRPLAAARAVIFCQMVDDPSAVPEEFPMEEDQEKERLRLFALISELVQWENTTNEKVLNRARAEIRRSWRRCCADNADHPEAAELFNPEKLPGFHDPFAGGGALPLEAQRLGMEAYASDLNPVAVLINKAMIEIPPKFAGMPPVNPKASSQSELLEHNWEAAKGLACDVFFYGEWMNLRAKESIGSLYPKVLVTPEMADKRPDLRPYIDQELTIVSWLWTRTVESPSPAFAGVHVPLVQSFIISSKKGNEAYVVPLLENDGYSFSIRRGIPGDDASKNGTKASKGANFRCLMSGSVIPSEYIKEQGLKGAFGVRLLAVVVDGNPGRVYLDPSVVDEQACNTLSPDWKPTQEIFYDPAKGANYCVLYGLQTFGDLFTLRQLVALNTFCALLADVRSEIISDFRKSVALEAEEAGCNTERASDYANAICTYLAFAIDKGANYWSSLCAWNTSRECVVSTFSRQALPMVWDFCEANPFSDSTGNWMLGVSQAVKMLNNLGKGQSGTAVQLAAQTQSLSRNKIIGTDPPYYDNIGYADLSEFFYVWIRRSLSSIYPHLTQTLGAPKAEELVAIPSRHGGKKESESFFLSGMQEAMKIICRIRHPAFPLTIFYAFRQTEVTSERGIVSTGWETFLGAVLSSGLQITGTWPIRTELTGNLKKTKAVLASSMVLVCDSNSAKGNTTRHAFRRSLSRIIPDFVKNLENIGIAPVDVQQSVIGPGIQAFSAHGKVLNPDDSAMSVREALAEINNMLDQYLSQDEASLDIYSRFAVALYESFGYAERDFGDAEGLAKARNLSVDGVVKAGILRTVAGKVQLLQRSDLPDEWDPYSDKRLCVWEATQQLIKRLEADGEAGAAALLLQLKNLPGRGDLAANCRALAYRLYNHCEKTKQAEEARSYNGLVIAWPELERQASAASTAQSAPLQTSLI